MGRNEQEIQVAVFDVGNVIFRFTNGLRWLSGLLGAPEDIVRQSWLSVDDRACRGEMGMQEVWAHLAREHNYTGPEIDFLKGWAKNFEPIIQTHQLLADLLPVVAVGLLTNVYPGGMTAAIEAGAVPNLDYKFVVESCKVKSVKPEVKIFAAAEAAAGVKPTSLLLVDDLVSNVIVAQQRNWQGLVFMPGQADKSVARIRKMLAVS